MKWLCSMRVQTWKRRFEDSPRPWGTTHDVIYLLADHPVKFLSKCNERLAQMKMSTDDYLVDEVIMIYSAIPVTDDDLVGTLVTADDITDLRPAR